MTMTTAAQQSEQHLFEDEDRRLSLERCSDAWSIASFGDWDNDCPFASEDITVPRAPPSNAKSLYENSRRSRSETKPNNVQRVYATKSTNGGKAFGGNRRSQLVRSASAPRLRPPPSDEKRKHEPRVASNCKENQAHEEEQSDSDVDPSIPRSVSVPRRLASMKYHHHWDPFDLGHGYGSFSEGGVASFEGGELPPREEEESCSSNINKATKTSPQRSKSKPPVTITSKTKMMMMRKQRSSRSVAGEASCAKTTTSANPCGISTASSTTTTASAPPGAPVAKASRTTRRPSRRTPRSSRSVAGEVSSEESQPEARHLRPSLSGARGGIAGGETSDPDPNLSSTTPQEAHGQPKLMRCISLSDLQSYVDSSPAGHVAVLLLPGDLISVMQPTPTSGGQQEQQQQQAKVVQLRASRMKGKDGSASSSAPPSYQKREGSSSLGRNTINLHSSSSRSSLSSGAARGSLFQMRQQTKNRIGCDSSRQQPPGNSPIEAEDVSRRHGETSGGASSLPAVARHQHPPEEAIRDSSSGAASAAAGTTKPTTPQPGNILKKGKSLREVPGRTSPLRRASSLGSLKGNNQSHPNDYDDGEQKNNEVWDLQRVEDLLSSLRDRSLAAEEDGESYCINSPSSSSSCQASRRGEGGEEGGGGNGHQHQHHHHLMMQEQQRSSSSGSVNSNDRRTSLSPARTRNSSADNAAQARQQQQSRGLGTMRRSSSSRSLRKNKTPTRSRNSGGHRMQRSSSGRSLGKNNKTPTRTRASSLVQLQQQQQQASASPTHRSPKGRSSNVASTRPTNRASSAAGGGGSKVTTHQHRDSSSGQQQQSEQQQDATTSPGKKSPNAHRSRNNNTKDDDLLSASDRLAPSLVAKQRNYNPAESGDSKQWKSCDGNIGLLMTDKVPSLRRLGNTKKGAAA